MYHALFLQCSNILSPSCFHQTYHVASCSQWMNVSVGPKHYFTGVWSSPAILRVSKATTTPSGPSARWDRDNSRLRNGSLSTSRYFKTMLSASLRSSRHSTATASARSSRRASTRRGQWREHEFYHVVFFMSHVLERTWEHNFRSLRPLSLHAPIAHTHIDT